MTRTDATRQLAGTDVDDPFVGRDAELATILRAWDTVLDGKSRVLLLSGEPGIGKTRLAEEALTRARRATSVALVGRCFEQQSSIPFSPFSEVFTAAWKV